MSPALAARSSLPFRARAPRGPGLGFGSGSGSDSTVRAGIARVLAVATISMTIAAAGCGPDERLVERRRENPLTTRSEGDRLGPLEDQQTALLRSIVGLIQRAADNPGGKNFDIATENLNQLFEGTPAERYKLSSETRRLFETLGKLPVNIASLDDLESPRWDPRWDGRHIEDCLLYNIIARRAAGPDGDTLARLRRVFDWVTRHVAVAPPDWLAFPGQRQVEVRPYDALVRGLAVEEGVWAERSWVFMALARQLNVDTALLALGREGETQVIPFAVGALIDGELYLFDVAGGLEFPAPDGSGVATLRHLRERPEIVEELGAPDRPFPVTAKDAREGLLFALVDSSRGYHCPKMKLLQDRLVGDIRMILHRDPAEMFEALSLALEAGSETNANADPAASAEGEGGAAAENAPAPGSRAGVGFWDMPARAQQGLFYSPVYQDSIRFSLTFFTPELPLLRARMAQLRGEINQSKTLYVNMRFADKVEVGEKGNMVQLPEAVQDMVNLYATHFLALGHLESGDASNAARMFEQTLKLCPEPEKGEPFPHLFRWSALSNLSRLYEAEGRLAEAIRDASFPNPTSEGRGGKVRARRILLAHPMLEPAEPRPEAPKPKSYGRSAPQPIAGPGPGPNPVPVPAGGAATPDAKSEAAPKADSESGGAPDSEPRSEPTPAADGSPKPESEPDAETAADGSDSDPGR